MDITIGHVRFQRTGRVRKRSIGIEKVKSMRRTMIFQRRIEEIAGINPFFQGTYFWKILILPLIGRRDNRQDDGSQPADLRLESRDGIQIVPRQGIRDPVQGRSLQITLFYKMATNVYLTQAPDHHIIPIDPQLFQGEGVSSIPRDPVHRYRPEITHMDPGDFSENKFGVAIADYMQNRVDLAEKRLEVPHGGEAPPA